MKRFLGSPRKVTQSHMFSSPGSRFCSASAMAMPAISVDSMVSQGSVRLASVRLVGRRREGTPSNAERRLPAGPPEPTPSRPGPRPPRRGSKTSPAPAPPRPRSPRHAPVGLVAGTVSLRRSFPGLPLYWTAEGTNLCEGVSSGPHVAAVASTWAAGVAEKPAAVPGQGTEEPGDRRCVPVVPGSAAEKADV